MAEQFTVPEEYVVSFRRLLPYLAAPLQKNLQVLESLLIYLKVGGEKMARIAIDAKNVTQRLEDAEIKKQLREQELLIDENMTDDDDAGDDDDDDDDESQDDAKASSGGNRAVDDAE